MRCMCTMEYFSAIRKKKRTRSKMGGPRAVSQKWKDTYHMSSYMWNLKHGTDDLICRNRLTDTENSYDCQGEGGLGGCVVSL